MKDILTGNGTYRENMPTSSTTNGTEPPCAICGGTPFCNGLGVIRYQVPVDDPRFGKLFRCPHNPVEKDADRQAKLRKLSNLAAYADKTFEGFQIESELFTVAEQQSLRMAYERARDFAQHPRGWLVLQGSYGCGKTHLAAAIGNLRLLQGDTVLFITSPDLLDHLRGTFSPSAETGYDELFSRVRNCDLLILDDLGVENPSPWAQEKLFQLLNHRYTHTLPTVVTTNADIDKLDSRIRSRMLDLEQTARVVITAPDYRSRMGNTRTQLSSNLSLYESMTFETFEIEHHLPPEERENLAKVARAVNSYAHNPEDRWLVLMGGFGTGKTHLAAALAHYRQAQGEEVMFITVPDLMDYLRETFGPDSSTTLNQRFQQVRNVPLLVLDDLNTENASAWVREKLFQIIDYRYLTRLPTVFTTAKELEQLDKRIGSRILDDRRCTCLALTARSYVIRRKRR